MYRRVSLCVVTALLLGSAVPCAALYNRLGIPDSSEIRRTVRSEWFDASVSQVREKSPVLVPNDVGTVFQVRTEETETEQFVIVAPQRKLAVDVYTEKGVHASSIDIYPADAPGSWVLIRSRKTGEPLRVRFYFAADSGVYVQFRPFAHKVVADFVVFGAYAARGVPVGIPFEQLYSASFMEIYTLTEKTLPWSYADIVPGLYHPVLQMIAVIRENLERIAPADDAAYDENGEPVFISSGKTRTVPASETEAGKLSVSSAGFLKWIVDGLVVPLAGSYTKIEPLKTATVEYRSGSLSDVLSSEYNLSFSLDWTRNLAAAALSVYTGKTYYFDSSGADVISEPFSAEIGASGSVNALGYVADTGYRIEALKPLLYVFAAEEPGRFFLGAVRQTDAGRGELPEVRFFTECAAIFPYFDRNGAFSAAVFENGVEMTLDSFIRKYPETYVHLVRVNASERFFPQ